MKVSLITTVLNEENSIKKFLDSVLKQTKLPEELVIVDGGSTDGTVACIKYYVSSIKQVKIRLIIKSGNRSVGRNEAIKRSTGDVIAITDAGCILDKNWLKNITAPFVSKEVDVVAGYYKGVAKNVFQKCLIPYVLVMPDKVDAKTFLPSARSMAIRKPVWERIGGFPEKYSHNEDYVFAQRLKKKNASIVFVRNAVVHWIPRRTLVSAFSMFYRFAKGDTEARIIRPKVLLLLTRYVVGVLMLFLFFETQNKLYAGLVFVGILLYIAWTIQKSYRYVKSFHAFYLLPLLQFTADSAVILGSLRGFFSLREKLQWKDGV